MAPAPVLICGPTASGKSALALAIARRDGGIVINADALQVYSCWRILTARPTPEESALAPHLLYGHVACSETYSVGRWLDDIAGPLDAALRRGSRALIVGGTGLYFTALTRGLADIPAIPPQVRAEAERTAISAMAARLRADDPATWAAIDQRNPARIRRAWEVLAATGRGLLDWQNAASRPPRLPPEQAIRIVLDPDPAALSVRIEDRFRRMIAEGAIDEVRAVLAGGPVSAAAMKALGAGDLAAFLRHEITREEAIRRAVIATRRYAKRQRTWFRNQMADWRRVTEPPSDAEGLAGLVPPEG
jgi:tRNA dimethylallyltransferase